MRYLFLLLLSLNTFAAAPLGVSGLQDTTNNYPSVIKVPNKQATDIGSGKVLLSNCGMQSNLLANCSGEHKTAGSGWSSSVTSTATATYGSANTSTKEFGDKQITWSCAGGASGGTCLFYQDVTTSKTVSGVVGAYVSTTNAAATQFVSRVNGANNKSTTAQATSENYYKINETLGSSSTGIGVLVTVPASTTYTGTIDWAAVGAGDVRQDISVIGPWQSFTPTGSWTANTTYTGRYRQVGDTAEFDIYISTSGAPTATNLSINLPNSWTIDTNKFSAGSSTLGATYLSSVLVNDSGTTFYGPGQVTPNNSTSVFIRGSIGAAGSFATSGTVSNTSPFTFGAGDFVHAVFVLPITQLSGASTVYSAQNADTDWQSCGHTTSDFTGFGTVTNIETQCKRDGSDLLMKGKFTAGTTTGVEARINLKFNSTTMTSADTARIPSLQIAGQWGRGANDGSFYSSLNEPSVTYITAGAGVSSTSSVLTKALGTALAASGNSISFTSRTPISGWTNSNVIIGTFNEVMTKPGISKPVRYQADIDSSDNVTNESTDWINGNCTNATTGFSNCVPNSNMFASGTPIRCWTRELATSSGNDSVHCKINAAETSSLIQVTCKQSSAYINYGYTIFCEGQAP